MCKVLRPGGYLAVSTPNLLWYPVVRTATTLRFRPFDGLENFSTFRSIRSVLESEQLSILKEKGLHIIPFQLPMKRDSQWCDHHAQALRRFMINLCVFARKK